MGALWVAKGPAFLQVGSDRADVQTDLNLHSLHMLTFDLMLDTDSNMNTETLCNTMGQNETYSQSRLSNQNSWNNYVETAIPFIAMFV